MSKNLLGQETSLKFEGTKEGVFSFYEESDGQSGNLVIFLSVLLIILNGFPLHAVADFFCNWIKGSGVDFAREIRVDAEYFKNPNDHWVVLLIHELKYIKALLFDVTLIALLYISVKQVYCFFRKANRVLPLKDIARISFFVFIVFNLLIFPWTNDGFFMTLYGLEYAYMSVDPFMDHGVLFSQRLVVPALANVFKFQGVYLYMVFSAIAFYLCIFLCAYAFYYIPRLSVSKSLWNDLRNFNFWIFLSFATSSFIMSLLQMYGRPDSLCVIIMLLLLLVPQTKSSLFAFAGLGLVTHEIMAILFIPFLLFCYPRKWSLIGGGMVFLYAFFFFVVPEILGIQGSVDVGVAKAYSLVFDYPLRWMLGGFFAFKFFWIIIAWYLLYLVFAQKWRLFFIVGMFFLVPCVTAFIGWDTSRLIGYAFIAVLFSLWAYEDFYKGSQVAKRILYLVCFLNIFMPSPWGSTYISSESGLLIMNGFYLYYARFMKDMALFLYGLVI